MKKRLLCCSLTVFFLNHTVLEPGAHRSELERINEKKRHVINIAVICRNLIICTTLVIKNAKPELDDYHG